MNKFCFKIILYTIVKLLIKLIFNCCVCSIGLVDTGDNPGFLTEAGYNVKKSHENSKSQQLSHICPPSYVHSPLYKAVILADKHLVQTLLSKFHLI